LEGFTADNESARPAPSTQAEGREAEAPIAADVPPRRQRRWQLHTERSLLAILLAMAAWVRLVGPGVLEPNVSTVEVSNLAATEGLFGSPGIGLLGWTSTGASGLALLPSAWLRAVHPEPELALRLYAALGSLAFVGLFYWLCRTRFSPLVSLATTALLAFAPWSIFFGRNGELQAFVGAWSVAAILALQRALRGGGPRAWVLAGALSTLGLYWDPSAVWLLPALLVPIVWALVDSPRARPRLIVALCVFLAAAVLVAAPRIPSLVGRPITTAGLLASEGVQPPPPAPLRVRAQQAIRAFLLLDPTVPGDPRTQITASAPLDAVTGVLLLFGLVLAAWHLPRRVLPIAVFLIPLAGSQLAGPRVPAIGEAFVALPGLYLLVADPIARLLGVLPFASVVRAAVLVAIPAYAVFGWHAYGGWIGSAASAQARQPALDYDEVDAWADEQRAQLRSGQPAATARAWREQHPRLATGSQVVRRPRGTGAAPAGPDLSQIRLQLVGTAAGGTGDMAPRAVAASRNGTIYAADIAGRLSRFDQDKNALVPLARNGPPLDQITDLAADADGFVYLADAERSVLVKLAPTGAVAATIGADWGMYRPRGLAIGPDGRLYVADTGRNRIAVGTPDGRFQKSIVPPTSFGTFEQPTEVAVDASGRIYVGLPELGRLAILDESGQVLGGWAVPKANTIESSRITVIADGAIAITDPAQATLTLEDADGRELATSDLPGRPLGVALANDRLIVAEPATGRLMIYSLTGK
jgi:hypothetical protein